MMKCSPVLMAIVDAIASLRDYTEDDECGDWPGDYCECRYCEAMRALERLRAAVRVLNEEEP